MQKRGKSTGNQEKIKEKEKEIEEKEKEIKEKELEYLTFKLELNSLSNDNQKSIHSEKLQYLERTINDLRRQMDCLRRQLDCLLMDKRILQVRIEAFVTEKSEILKTLKGLEALESHWRVCFLVRYFLNKKPSLLYLSLPYGYMLVPFHIRSAYLLFYNFMSSFFFVSSK